MALVHSLAFRVRYAETDQMGALNSPRALEWFEFGRTEWLRAAGMPYCQMERDGLFLPVVEARCRYQRRVGFDDAIVLRTWLSQVGRASMRFEYEAVLDGVEEDGQVLAGWTAHAFVGASGQIIRPPAGVVGKLRDLAESQRVARE
jgi:acyl-CoA thioester hydrolase